MADWTPEGAEEWTPEGAEEGAPAKSGPSRTDAALAGANQGASFGFGDELQAGVGALGSSLGLPTLDAGEEEAVSGQQSIGGRYKALLDRYRSQNKAAKEAHPWVYGGSELGAGLAGGVVSGIGKAKQAVGLGQRVIAGAKGAAPLGALYGAGSSESDSIGGTLGDAAAGGATAALVGGGFPLLGAGVKKIAGPVAEYLKKKAIEQGTKAISGVTNSLSASGVPSEAAVERAIRSGAVLPGGTTAGIADRLQGQADELGPIYGDIIAGLKQAGVTGSNAELLAREAEKRFAHAKSITDQAGMTEWRRLAKQLRDAVPNTPFSSRLLDLEQQQAIKEIRQKEAQAAYDAIQRLVTPTQEAKMASARLVREEMEKAVANQSSKAPDLAAQFEPVKRELSLVFDALEPAMKGASRGAKRSPISLTGTIAGGAVKASGGGAIKAIATALGHDALKQRVPSTVATSAYGLSRLLGGASRVSPAAQDEVGRFAALIAALRGPGTRLEAAPAGAEERRDR